MIKIIDIANFKDKRGNLSVIENCPFKIERLYYIYNNTKGLSRGGHKHKKTFQALICLRGNFDLEFFVNGKKHNYFIDDPNKMYLVNPEHWHEMKNMSKNCFLLVLASEKFDVNDYIYEK